ncbi:hypothetical protein JTI58_10880 [Lysinibacillus fusiformis]|uniref:hypothetical protein n=1 Tax=Lysinibacillus fusiformis TaxID=28031 RepID=UPI001966EF00|nr:hypothetical protein [Lysinibacillus fusiformis]QSB12069.1 hypothetical protein JTI58_10880 [Lysinibacillus fusiformis]
MQFKELVRIYAYLPVKLSELSKVDPEAAINLLQDWGEGKETIRKIWEETHKAIEENNNS